MLRILHTADWHLGHTLHTMPREHEHRCFLEWLTETLATSDIDALLICGDVFETIHPAAAALAAFYSVLAGVRARCPRLDVVVIGGNHDSAARLEVAAPILEAIGVRVVGGISRSADGALDVERMCVPLRAADGSLAAWCAAVPFLRLADLRSDAAAAGDPVIAGVRAVYDAVHAALETRRTPAQALISLGHGYLVGTELSELSERRVLGGNQHALPVDLFPRDIGYAALGHLHKAQRVGGRENVRYSGSPIPLSMAEIDYAHQVVIATFDGPQCIEIRPQRVPRSVEFARIPARGFGALDRVLTALAGLPARDAMSAECARPYLEVRVALERPEPDLRRRVEAALEGRQARLVKLSVETAGHGRSLAEQVPDRDLQSLQPEAVFRSCYARAHDSAPDDELLAEFDALLERVRAVDGEGSA